MLNWSNTRVIARLKQTKPRTSCFSSQERTKATLCALAKLCSSAPSELLKSEQFICKPSLNLILIEFTPDIPQAV